MPTAPIRPGIFHNIYTTTRRRFIHTAGSALTGATVLPSLLSGTAQAQEKIPDSTLRFVTADGKDPGHRLVIVFMQGGISNWEMFDPKTKGRAKSVFDQVRTGSDVKMTNLLWQLAPYANQFVTVNNLFCDSSDHDKSAAEIFTGSQEVEGGTFLSPARYTNPFLQFAKYLDKEVSGGVGYVVTHQSKFDQSGYDRRWETPWGGVNHNDPLTVYVPYNSKSGSFENPINRDSSHVSRDRLRERIQLLEMLESRGHLLVGDPLLKHDSAYGQAKSMVFGNFSEAFKLERESPETLLRYGDTEIGKQLLLTRRMLNSGARVVVVNDGNYDNHYGLEKDMRRMVPQFSQGLASFIEDINKMDERVDIAIISEFGRSPLLNDGIERFGFKITVRDPGRHHWTNAFGMTIISNRPNEIGGGRVIGQTNNDGEIEGDAFHSSLVPETLLNLLGFARFEMRGDVPTNIRFPAIDIIKERVKS